MIWPKTLKSDSSAPSGRLHPLVVLWRRVFGLKPPKRTGPCKYCGEVTDNENPFCPGLFAHRGCRDAAWEIERVQKRKREKIELIKTALREIEAEKHNTDSQTIQ